jgi:hypothetical protein
MATKFGRHFCFDRILNTEKLQAKWFFAAVTAAVCSLLLGWTIGHLGGISHLTACLLAVYSLVVL